MIDTGRFYNYLIEKDMDFFSGVPDSLLNDLCACIEENAERKKHIIAANEGNAIALAAGYHLSSGKYGVVYMQNSGIGNAVNPLLSLADEKVYSIPMLLIVGWRGEPGVKDEPQHIKQGEVTLSLFEAMGIKTVILEDNFENQIDECYQFMSENNKPIALIVRKGAFSKYKFCREACNYRLTREESLEIVLESLNEDDLVVSTTGKTSREIFEIRERKKQGHTNDFLTVGSMGHTASIALGMSLATDKNVYCIDGDGSFLMHMGGFCIVSQIAGKNFKYILINNGAHESVGGQPTAAFDVNVEGILKNVGFEQVYQATDRESIERYLKEVEQSKLNALVIYTKQGSRKDLGRPTVMPEENKIALMEKIGTAL